MPALSGTPARASSAPAPEFCMHVYACPVVLLSRGSIDIVFNSFSLDNQGPEPRASPRVQHQLAGQRP
eukprot:8797497-Lingulodinium_polyedra.AAC.1